MRLLTVLFVVSVVALGVLAQEKKPPAKLVFEAKVGNVTFDHAAHVKREKGNCKVCHDKLWPQEKAPLNFKTGVHKPAEANHTSCGACHNPGGSAGAQDAGGQAFESKGNCNKCHVKAAAKQG